MKRSNVQRKASNTLYSHCLGSVQLKQTLTESLNTKISQCFLSAFVWQSADFREKEKLKEDILRGGQLSLSMSSVLWDNHKNIAVDAGTDVDLILLLTFHSCSSLSGRTSGASYGQVCVCVSGRGLGTRGAASLLRNG